ncbi:DnaD domain protein [Halobacillus litoralis]|uniref:replication initiation and membrane attachment family protein n=1 Tax=Halobacillus litoralis TaxID=45668 RepID=UPI001CD51524|nr:DnaD domain protein [Halobacillus litoralis]MCA0969852.1 DnaD domain protein [Halobacillus litoralis]
MNSSIGKLLPVDGFKLMKRGESPKGTERAMTHLYQPIIGRLAVALYQTLVSEFEINGSETAQTHHTLMSYLSAPLDQIYEARKYLEAIGLIQTYQTNDANAQREYFYILNPPFSPEEFFRDNMLSLLLYHEIGENKYKQLKSRLVRPELSLEGFDEVTASFDEVFHAITTNGPVSVSEPKAEGSQAGPAYLDNRVDFEWLSQSLKDKMYVSERILTGANKRIISQLASLYNLSSLELEKAVTWALDENHQLIIEELKTACHDFMKEKPTAKKDHQLDLRDKVQVESSDENKSKRDQLAERFEQISPRELLEDLSRGNHAADQDLKVVRDIMTEQGLSPGVMNVLIHYVMLRTDKKLSKPYVEKIASHWARKNVQTVHQAMSLATAEHQKYQQWGQQKTFQRKNTKEEVIPDWFYKQKKRNQTPTGDESVDTNELAEQLKQLTNRGNS